MADRKVEKKLYHIQNRERILDYHKQYYEDNKEICIERAKAWAAVNKDKRKIYMRRCMFKKQYGISLDEYEAMFAKQKGVCAICCKPESRKNRLGETKLLSVDHDHATGEVRGLLCNDCNLGLGHFKDDGELLTNALKYLLGR